MNGTPESDRPLIVQLCGSDKKNLLYTIKYIIESKNGVDGIDLNCGCPQTIARRGMYGAFLLEKDGGDTIVDLVSFLVKEVGHLIPISVKVRILPSGVEDSLKLYGRLVDAGAAMLTIHGRTRLQKMYDTGAADWDAIKRTVDMYGHRVPILSNGSISNLDDVVACLEHTGADGIMSSEAVLEYPPIFTESGTAAVGGKRTGPSRLSIARQYLQYSEQYPPNKAGQGSGMKCIRAHFHRILHGDLEKYFDVRLGVAQGNTYEAFWKVCDDLQAIYDAEGHDVTDETLSWYMRHRMVQDEGEDSSKTVKQQQPLSINDDDDEEEKKCVDPDEADAQNFSNLFGSNDDDDDDYDYDEEEGGEKCW